MRDAKLIFSCLLAACAFTAASPQPASANESPKGENNRLRFKCLPSGETGTGHFLAGVIDWKGDEGLATLAVLKTYLGEGYYGGEAPERTKLIKEMRVKVVLQDDGVNQVIRQLDSDKQNDIFITWKSDLPEVVPRRQYFIYKGQRFNMQDCSAEVKPTPHGR